MLAEQVVQEVAAGRGLGDQMMVVKLVEQAASALQAGVIEGGGGVAVDVMARDQAQPAEQPLLGCGEVGVGQVERRRDRQVLGPHDGQPVAGGRQVGGEFGGGPGRVMPQLAGQHPDRQRQVPAQPGDLPGRARLGAQVGAPGQPGQQHRGLLGRHDLHADHDGVFERGQAPAAGDQNKAVRGARQQRPDLLLPGRVVQQQQDPLARDVIAPAARPGFQAGRDLLRGHPRRQSASWPARPPGRPAAGRACGRAAGGRTARRGSRGPAGARRGPPGSSCRCQPFRRWRGYYLRPALGHVSQQPRQLGLAAGKAPDVTRQRPRRRGRRVAESAQRRELRLQARGAHLENLLRAPQVFQLVHAQVDQHCARRKRVPHQGCRRLRHQDLATVPTPATRAARCTSRPTGPTAVSDASPVCTPIRTRTRSPAGPRMALEGLLHLHRRRHARPRRRERGEEPVPQRVQFPAIVRGQNRPDQRVMIGQQLRVHAFTHTPQQRSRALDIREQKRQSLHTRSVKR